MKTRRRATFIHLFFQIWQRFDRVSNLDGKDEAAVCTVGSEELPLVRRARCSEGRQDWKVVREAVWGRIITTQFLENGDFWRACQIWCYIGPSYTYLERRLRWGQRSQLCSLESRPGQAWSSPPGSRKIRWWPESGTFWLSFCVSEVLHLHGWVLSQPEGLQQVDGPGRVGGCREQP